MPLSFPDMKHLFPPTHTQTEGEIDRYFHKLNLTFFHSAQRDQSTAYTY